MLNKEILEIMTQLREDVPDFSALENINIRLASDIAYWVYEDRIRHATKRNFKQTKRPRSARPK